MGNGGGQFTHGGHPGDMREFGLGVKQCFFGLPGRGHVHQCADVLNASTVVEQRVGEHLHVLDPPIGHDQSMFHFDQVFPACGLLQDTVDNRQVIGMSARPNHAKRRRNVQRVFENA
ncbi:hypothetical protein D3C80_1463910 [compost metagenome]